MLPTPGTKSTKLDITMNMKNVVANGKTQPATRLFRMSPIKPSHPSTSDSIAFCLPDGISLTRFHVVRRTMTRMIAATIQVQIIEFVTGQSEEGEKRRGSGRNQFLRRFRPSALSRWLKW